MLPQVQIVIAIIIVNFDTSNGHGFDHASVRKARR
jgi:hypothetical protein